jgi:GSH-dependent disulfide-bond oxidoreductase
MIDLYTFGTGNGHRAAIALEECALPYVVHKVDFTRGEQDTPAFRKINPFGKIPVIVDSDGPGGRRFVLAQSGAILLYCAEKSGRFLPADPLERITSIQWMIHAVSDGGDVVGALIRLSKLPDPPRTAIEHYAGRLKSLLQVFNTCLADREYLVGDISIADLAFYTVAAYGVTQIGLDAVPNIARWLDALSVRPGIVKGMAVPS